MEKFLSNLSLPRLIKYDVVMLEAPITLEEMTEATESLKVDAAPGLDGYTPEYYKKFKDILVPYLIRLFLAYLEKNELPESWREVKVIAIPKQGKDLALAQSYRPITLLNVNYKILTTVLAE